MFKKQEKRFVEKYTQNLGLAALQIVVDTVTGVNYLCTIGTGAYGITPLLDRNGNVVVDEIELYKEK